MSDKAELNAKHVIKNNKLNKNKISKIKKIKYRQHIMGKAYRNYIT